MSVYNLKHLGGTCTGVAGAPLGCPVLPLVNRMYARLEGLQVTPELVVGRSCRAPQPLSSNSAVMPGSRCSDPMPDCRVARTFTLAMGENSCWQGGTHKPPTIR